MNIKIGRCVETQINTIINELLTLKGTQKFYIDFTYETSLNNLIHTIRFNVMIGVDIFDYQLSYSPTGISKEWVQVNYCNYNEGALEGIFYVYNAINEKLNLKANLQYSEVV